MQNAAPAPSSISNIGGGGVTTSRRPSHERLILWRLHGSEHELLCTAITTSFGYALSLELAGEPILLELQRTADRLATKATRLEAWLLTQGWQRIRLDSDPS
jgi:hypothetical protein